MRINIFGSTGFVGKNLVNYLKNDFEINIIKNINEYDKDADVYINLIGKAHDLNRVSNPSDYYIINTDLTKKIFDDFTNSNSKVFIYLSSVKAITDNVSTELTEYFEANPTTHYGKSKLFAEHYILRYNSRNNKRIYILRPCMIHGPGNKGNLNLLYRIVSKGLPWPLGLYTNKKSFCSIDNLCFIIKHLIDNESIKSDVYNVADNDSISTLELVKLIGECLGNKPIILNIPKFIINIFAIIGNFFNLSFNRENLHKLTDSYVVSNKKILNEIKNPLPMSTREGLIKTINSFKNV
jgi:nucleoside-diphosphate-sugar epimerase